MEERRQQENMILRLQCDEIAHYVSQFPPAEHEARALEWIENHASTYRANIESVIDFVNRRLEQQKENT